MIDHAVSLGERLRSLRRIGGPSLVGVEHSCGMWKAAVVGSYEHGERAITARRLSRPAQSYAVPVVDLLPRAARAARPASSRPLTIDLRHLADLPHRQGAPLVRYAAAIGSQRSESGMGTLSMREHDLRALAAIYDITPAGLLDRLLEWGVLAS